ncbi:hypothetical protein QHF84_27715 [Polyangium sp. y55x31]|nr:hypothetical protein [Polyangium sp. y55x31]
MPPAPAPAGGRPAGPPVQAKLVITSGQGSGTYTSDNLLALLDGPLKTRINQNDLTVKRGPLAFVRAKGTYTIDTLQDLVDYMTDLSAPAPVMEMVLEYGAAHGDYHFTGNVTVKKAQWTVDKETAKGLMETAINTHMATLLAGSGDEGWTAWYIGDDAGYTIGKTVAGDETQFCIQLQVSKEHNLISYHGYPDQRLRKLGVGKTKKDLGD